MCYEWTAHRQDPPPAVCDNDFTNVTALAGFAVFSYATFAGFVGSAFVIVSFTRMLHATQDAMEAGEAFTPDGERPQRFNRGPAWLVVVLQLVVEYIATGFFSSMYYGFLPSAVALMRLIRGGHRMKYISAASLDAGEHGTALCDCG